MKQKMKNISKLENEKDTNIWGFLVNGANMECSHCILKICVQCPLGHVCYK